MEPEQRTLLSPDQLRRSYPQAFEKSWNAYPRRDGPTSKADAYRQWVRRLSQGYEAAQIHEGVIRYAKHCERSGKTGTSFVMQCERFFGQGEHFLSDYDQPAQPSLLAAHRRVWKPPTERAENVPAGFLTDLVQKAIRRERQA